MPLLLLTLTLGCLVGASGEEDTPSNTESQGVSSSAHASSGEAALAQVIIATVTPVPQRETSQLAVMPSPTDTAVATATSTEVPTETPTEEPVQAVLQAVPTDTPVPPSETPTETPTETATPSETPTKTPTGTATPSPTATKTPSPTATSPSVPATGFRAVLLDGHNQVRGLKGLSPLSLNATLNQIAQERAETMAAEDYMTHYNPDGSTAFDMMNARGYSYSDGAENIAYNLVIPASNSVYAAMQQWIDSPPHYANILKGNLTLVGFGQATSSSGNVYYSAVFSD